MSVILFYAGLAVSTVSLAAFALLTVIILFYNFIDGYEEKLMAIKFGEEYSAYKQKTG